MSEKLEDYIKKNHDQFDLLEPDPVIWGRIEHNMAFKSGRNWRLILVRAAGVVLIIALSVLGSEWYHHVRGNKERTDLSIKKDKKTAIPELKEAEAYYTGIINEKLTEMKTLAIDYPDVERELQADFYELDSIYMELKHDLKDNMSNQEVIQAIINNYRLKIDILEDILTELDPDSHVVLPPKKNEQYGL